MKTPAILLLSISLLLGSGMRLSARPTFDVKSYGATGDGKTKDTASFQRALDAASAAGGGDVLIPAGNFLIGSIELKSNTTLRLDKNSHLLGSPDMADYPITKVR